MQERLTSTETLCFKNSLTIYEMDPLMHKNALQMSLARSLQKLSVDQILWGLL